MRERFPFPRLLPAPALGALLVWFAAGQAAGGENGGAGAVVTADRGWCVVTTPDRVKAGEKFSVTVTPKEDGGDLGLGGDVHFRKANGIYVTYGFWGGRPKKPVRAGQPIRFEYTMPEAKKDAEGIYIHYYLSPDGWKEKTKDAASELVLYPDAPARPKPKTGGRPATATLKKSWLMVGEPRKGENSSPGDGWVEGDTLVLPIDYFVDPEDDWGGTALRVDVHGPWIDNPDGKYTQKRQHVGYPGLSGKSQSCRVGERGRLEFVFKIPKPHTYGGPDKGKRGDSLMFACAFRGTDGKNWPWEIRTSLRGFARRNGFFELEGATPGNLFLYDAPVAMRLVLGGRAKADGEKTAVFAVHDPAGELVKEGRVAFTPEGPGQTVALPLDDWPPERRGTFRLTAKVDGWETRETTFARIPDVPAALAGGSGPFGGQKFSGDARAAAAARALGMGAVRVWVGWNRLQPAPDVWSDEAVAALHRDLDTLNEAGLRPWLLVDYPPAWAIDNPKSWRTRFSPFPFRDDEWSAFVDRLATEYGGKILGFEWLNEIVPGNDTPDPVGDYVRFCRIATDAANRAVPGLRHQLAGGLWPRSFRKALLAAGAARHADILSVHYETGAGIRQARGDLAAVGEAERVAVWDNETARGASTWGMPVAEALADPQQSRFMMTQFPDELIAGAEKIVVFGGEPDPAGNWSHFWGDMSPRPAAATLAVLAAKLGRAKPIGRFPLGRGGRALLFEAPDGRAVLVVSSAEKEGEAADLPVGAGRAVVATDHQGNERPVEVRDGAAALALAGMPYFVEGGNPDVLKAQLVAQLSEDGSAPQLTLPRDVPAVLPVRLHNHLDRPLGVRLALDGMAGAVASVAVRLAPGESVSRTLAFTPGTEGAFDAFVAVAFDDPVLPAPRLPWRATVIDPARLGNLAANPAFLRAGSSGETSAEGWGGSGRHGARIPHDNPGEPGHGGWVYAFRDLGGEYGSINQSMARPAPGEYVYALWIKADGLQTGSNAGVTDAAGKIQTLSWMKIFHAPAAQAYWDVFRARITVPEGAKALSISPVARRGGGAGYIDNAVLAPYEGTEYVAFAPRAPGAVAVDGDLTDFDRSAPVPLLGKSQLAVHDKGYAWTPANLAGAAWFNWDEQHLYVAFEVVDDRHVAARTGDDTALDDSVEIALHPLNRRPGENARAFMLQASAASPGAGGGRHTLHRPDDRAGGLKSGALARDSSQYEIAVRRADGKTVYEFALPWNDLGGVVGAPGAKLGLSLALHDNDGEGRQATMLWGEGLFPAWSPEHFGQLTLVGR